MDKAQATFAVTPNDIGTYTLINLTTGQRVKVEGVDMTIATRAQAVRVARLASKAHAPLCDCTHPRHHHHIGAQRPCAVEGCQCADYHVSARKQRPS